MAKSLNKLQLIGSLGATPELKTSAKGKNFCRLSLATTDGTGTYQKTNWHQIILWGKNAKAAAQYLAKGAQIYVEGSLGYDDYEKDGKKHREAVITGFNVIYLGAKPEGVAARLAVEEEPPW